MWLTFAVKSMWKKLICYHQEIVVRPFHFDSITWEKDTYQVEIVAVKGALSTKSKAFDDVLWRYLIKITSPKNYNHPVWDSHHLVLGMLLMSLLRLSLLSMIHWLKRGVVQWGFKNSKQLKYRVWSNKISKIIF